MKYNNSVRVNKEMLKDVANADEIVKRQLINELLKGVPLPTLERIFNIKIEKPKTSHEEFFIGRLLELEHFLIYSASINITEP